MKINIIKIKKSYYQADLVNLPGSPLVGYGKTKLQALACLFYSLYVTNVDMTKCIKENEPIVINGKMWKNPSKKKR